MRLTPLLVGIVSIVTALAGQAGAEGPKITPSGLEVPRYVSLKYAEVNARDHTRFVEAVRSGTPMLTA